MRCTQLVLLIVLLFFVQGCGGSSFPTAKTVGQVMCEGKPVAGAMVYFEPLPEDEAGNKLVGRQGFSFTDSNGNFDIATYDRINPDGAVVGKHRVRVGRGDADCNCSMDDEKDVMEVTVESGGDNKFTIELPKATAADRRAAQAAEEEDEDE